jgi:hypothetical protein
MRPRPEDRLQREKAKREELLNDLKLMLENVGSPGLEQLKEVGLSPSVLDSLAQGLRASSLEKRLRSSRKYLEWLGEAKSLVWTGDSVHLMRYLLMREAEPCGPTVPEDIVLSVKWFAKVGAMKENPCSDGIALRLARTIAERLRSPGGGRKAVRPPALMSRSGSSRL